MTQIPKEACDKGLVVKGVLPLALLAILTTGCTPTVRVEPSDKPITINMNVKIEHEIRVKVDKELDSILSEDSGLF
ncbi:hypothetical protein TDB9533_03500 [Thalassocella blandensis]|nr:hypothetical protein TDB9533_03500 [Thalassocella blandensis]